MRKIILLHIVGLLLVNILFAQDFTLFSDPRNGKAYKSIKIGSQTWMTENLNVGRFMNGDSILECKTYGEWRKAAENKQPAWCYYDNDPENGEKYGRLYNWYTILDSRKIAPYGWHVPSDKEWKALIFFLGDEKKAGEKLKSKDSWNTHSFVSCISCMNSRNQKNEYKSCNVCKNERVVYVAVAGNGTNSTGFTALPGGYRNSDGTFDGVQERSFWWTASETGIEGESFLPGEAWGAWMRDISNFDHTIRRYATDKNQGYYIRCIKN
jgi:uncharacterized protein (TIGR02145 family)